MNIDNKMQGGAMKKNLLLSRKWKTALLGIVLFLLPPLVNAQDGKWVVDPYLAGVALDKPLCQNLLKYLNSYQGCPGDIMATYPGFTSPPWQELDPKEHLDLIWQLLMFRGRADVYFRRGAAAKASPIPDTPATRRAATDFVAAGGKLRVWRARLFKDYGDPSRPVPPGEQTIIELRQSFSYDPKAHGPCPDNPKLLGGSTYIVTADVRGPDPSIPSPIADRLSTGELLLYEGEPYLVVGHGLVLRMQTSMLLPQSYPPFHYCGFRFDPLGGNQ